MNHDSEIKLCQDRAAAQLRMAEFINARCGSFPLVCPHSTDNSGPPSLHVYDLELAVKEFGADGWHACLYDPSNKVQKLVDGVLVSAARRLVDYIVPPSLP